MPSAEALNEDGPILKLIIKIRLMKLGVFSKVFLGFDEDQEILIILA